MNEAIDYSTVKWVKQELDATLKQARQALEAYVEHPDDESQLRFCAVHLHQVQGTLQMVELYGAALLAEEMEQVVEALLAGNVGQQQEAYELVMRAMLQLPDYLERLIAGGRDLPLVLLPLLNDLRAIRGQKLLSENSLFSPDLSIAMPAAARLDGHAEDFAAVVRKQRHSYQLALLGWFRGKDVGGDLDRLAAALRQLQAACMHDGGQRLWWIAGGMVSALRAGWLDTSMATKLLLGQVDRQIKRLLDEGEAAFAANPPADLLKNLLFYVARSTDGGEPVSLIKQTYRLSTLLPDSDELEQAQGSLSGHNAELMRTVSVAIKEDLARVKDGLDLFLRGGRKAPAELLPAAETLSRVADTLGMLGLGALRKATQNQAQAATDIAAGRRPAEETALMDIASALLYVESSLEGMVQGGAPIAEPEVSAAEESAGMTLPEAEFNQVRGVVADEAIRDIAQAKDAILTFMENPTDFGALDKLPQLFNQIKGGLLLLNEQRAAELINAVRSYVTERVLASQTWPADASLDDLADAISSVEYYLENLREGRVYGGTVLDVAAKSLARLGCPPEYSDSDVGDINVQSIEQSSENAAQVGDIAAEDIAVESIDLGDVEVSSLGGDDFFALPASDAAAADAEIADPFARIDDMEVVEARAVEELDDSALMESPVHDPVAMEPFEDPFSVEEIAPAALGAEPQADVPATQSPAPTAALPTHQVMSDDVDEEILEIFIEEAEEELGNIRDCLPRWLSNEEDRDALTTMRRSFHTLKGSGRLVGALRIGEFAWGYESMLNRLIEGVVVRSDAFCGLLERAAEALPELIEQIRNGAATTQPVETMMDMAQALSRGETVDLAYLDKAVQVTAVAVQDEYLGDAAAEDMAVTLEHVRPGAAIDDVDYFAFPSDVATFGGAAPKGIDPVLYDIFSHESHEHIGTIRRFLDNCCAQGESCRMTDELMRALHTLHGSARMAGADCIAEIAFEIEKYGKALRNDGLAMPNDGMRLISEALQTIEGLLPTLCEDGAAQPDSSELVAAIARLPRTTENVSHIPSAEVPNELDDDGALDALEFEEIALAAPDSDPFTDEVAGAPETSSMEQDAYADVAPDASADALSHSISDAFGDVAGDDAFFAEADTEEFIEPNAGVATDEHDSIANAEQPDAALVEPMRTANASAEGDWTTLDYQDIDADLLDVFLEEGDEILGAIDTTLQSWMAAADDHALMAELQRHLHTLKGGARMANIGAIGDLSHALESILIAVVDGQVLPSQALFDLLLQAQDRLAHMLEAARAQRPMRAATALIEQLESVRLGGGTESVTSVSEAGPQAEPATAAVAFPLRVGDEQVEAATAVAQVSMDDAKLSGRTQQELVRVRADLLDNMVNFAGEISIYRSRLEQQVGSMRFNLSELGQTVDRLRDQLRKLEIETEAQVLFRYERDGGSADDHFDPLEMDRYSHLQQLSRSMLEGIGDLVSIQGLLDNITRESETLLLQQARVNTELQEGLMRTRMVPFSGLAPRMRRILRQACQELGKRAELALEGAEGEMDRTVIDRIIAPIEHMLRNAIAHGIESPEQRAAAGKRPAGAIKVSLSRDGSDVVIKLADDGAGMNLAAIRRKARERGLITDDAELSDNDVMQFVLETGFSTAEQVSQISGRGVGMDVVNSEVKQLGGSLHIDSREGRGTTFTIRLPFTLAISQALLVQVHEEIYAIPLTGIEGIVRMSQEELARYQTDTTSRFEYGGYSYPVQNLGVMLGQGAPVLGPGAAKRLPVLLVRSGDHRMALQVESLLGSRETVVKSVGPQISTVRGISGATILGDGRVVLILDLGGLLRAGGVGVNLEPVAPLVESQVRALTVMVVDDSITVRKVTTRLLERNEMQVITAKDGVDAVSKLQEHIPDVMLLDIEMPRMDGFELATHVRNEPRLRGIPMIMITSRTGDKHRKRAMEIGVDRYLGKPFQESTLLDTIRELAEERRTNG